MVLKEIERYIVLTGERAIVFTVSAAVAILCISRILFLWLRNSSTIFTPKRRELPPDCLNDPIHGEHHYIQIKNVSLHYVENGDKSKPLMLFLHGFPDFWYSWRHQIKYFSKHYWTVAVDLRGYGNSEKPVGISQYKIKYLVDDVKNLIQALGKENCILVTHDWGSIIGWEFVFRNPKMVEKYVMIGVPPFFSTTSSWTQFIKSWYTYLFQIYGLPELYLSLNDLKIFDKLLKHDSKEDREAYKFMFGKPGAFTTALNYYRANGYRYLTSSYRRKKMQGMKLPKGLLIYTDNDPYIYITDEAVKNSVDNLQLSFIESAGHFIHRKKSDDTNKVIGKFVGIETLANDSLSGHLKSVRSDHAQS